MKSIIMSKKTTFILALATVTLGFYKFVPPSAWKMFRVRSVQASSAANPKPRTVVLSVDSTDNQGHTLKSIHTEAWKRDGSRVVIYESINPQSGETFNLQRRLLTGDRLKVEIFDRIASKSTLKVSEEDFLTFHLGAMRNPQEKCLKTFDGTDMAVAAGEMFAGEETVKGIQTVRVTRSNPEITSWYAPSFGCALVAEVVKFATKEGNQSQSVKTLISISDQEPAAELFSNPTTYEELRPSVLFAKNQKAVTGSDQPCNKAADEADDKRYLAQRP